MPSSLMTQSLLSALIATSLTVPAARAAGADVVSQGPAARTGAALAYDDHDGRLLLFGGRDGTDALLADTWEWDGECWARLPVSGPPAADGAQMVYDSGRRRMVLFGGSLDSDTFANRFSPQTWEWDGKKWTQAATTGPVARVGHSMAYDTKRHVVVLFGGKDRLNRTEGAHYLADTWEWDGSKWAERKEAGPAARNEQAMVYDGHRGAVLLFGGHAHPQKPFGDTWQWDGRRWTRVSETGASPRALHAMAYDNRSGKTILYGGYDGKLLADTWEWDGKSWTQVGTTGSPVRLVHGMAFDSARGSFVVFGGTDGTHPSADTLQWNGKAWVELACSKPARRIGHALARLMFDPPPDTSARLLSRVEMLPSGGARPGSGVPDQSRGGPGSTYVSAYSTCHRVPCARRTSGLR